MGEGANSQCELRSRGRGVSNPPKLHNGCDSGFQVVDSEHFSRLDLLTVGSLRESLPGKNKSVPVGCLVLDSHSQQAGCAETPPAAGGSEDW